MMVVFGANHISAAFQAVMGGNVNTAGSGPDLSFSTKAAVFKASFHSSCS